MIKMSKWIFITTLIITAKKWWTQPKSLPTRNECDIFKQWNIIWCLKRTAFRGNAGDPWRLSNREGSQMQQAGTQLFHFMKCLKLASLGLKGMHCSAGWGRAAGEWQLMVQAFSQSGENVWESDKTPSNPSKQMETVQEYICTKNDASPQILKFKYLSSKVNETWRKIKISVF